MPGKPRMGHYARYGIPPEMKPMADRKVLITGSSGMLGTDLCRELSGVYDVYGADIAAGRGILDAGKSFACDITDKDNVFDVVAKARPEVVIHTAAWTDVDGCEKDKEKAFNINTAGAKNVALACRESGAVMVYISTDFVFDGKKSGPYKESDKTCPLNIYAGSKLGGEEAIRDVLKEHFILRTSWLYGKRGKNFVDTIIENAGSGKELRVVSDQAGSPTYTADLAGAIGALLVKIFAQDGQDREKGYGVYHISNSGSVSWYEYAKTILDLIGSSVKVAAITSEELGRPALRPAMSTLDTSKFSRFTGFKARDWKSALKEYIKSKNQERSCLKN
jgi:dTDP-4-dehydrorhamnose reductase